MINLLGVVAISAAKTMILSMLTEKVILKVTLEILEWAANRSSNEVDDKLVRLFREQLVLSKVL